jgi:hypothetical protein
VCFALCFSFAHPSPWPLLWLISSPPLLIVFHSQARPMTRRLDWLQLDDRFLAMWVANRLDRYTAIFLFVAYTVASLLIFLIPAL